MLQDDVCWGDSPLPTANWEGRRKTGLGVESEPNDDEVAQFSFGDVPNEDAVFGANGLLPNAAPNRGDAKTGDPASFKRNKLFSFTNL